jgi:hypothetical protein
MFPDGEPPQELLDDTPESTDRQKWWQIWKR